MNSSSDAAESMVKMTLEGTQVALRITGSAAKNLGVALLAISKGKTKTRGKSTLNKMLRSGKELKVFTLNKDDLKKFAKEAKKYGVLYTVIVNNKQSKKDGMVDIIVRAEDAAKINRIFERFKFSAFEKASVKKEDEKAKNDKYKDNGKVADDAPAKKEHKDKINENSSNLNRGSEQNPRSDSSLKHLKEGYKKRKRPSVRKLLKDLKNQIDKKNIEDAKTKGVLENITNKEHIKKIKSNSIKR